MNLICGINPVLEALSAGTRHFDRLLVVKGLRNRRVSEAIRKATKLAVPLRFETRETLDRMAGEVPHQGLIAVVSAKPVMALESLLTTLHDPTLLVVLDGVEDPRNLGAILRSAEAAGVDGVLLPERHSAGLSETVARASAGALEHVRVARVGNLVQALEALKERGIWVVGFDAAGGERWDAVDLKRPIALVLGGEGHGMRRLVREHCDHLVSLPLFGHVESLNVSVVAGIALYEAVRQRGLVPSHVRPIRVKAPASVPQVFGPAADDAENDPGASAAVRSFAAEDEDGAPGLDEESRVTVELHEEAAWTGPTVLKPVDFRRGPPRRHGRDRDRPHGGREGGGRGHDAGGRGHEAGRAHDGSRAPEGNRGQEGRGSAGEDRRDAPGGGPEGRRNRRRRRGGHRPGGAPAEGGEPRPGAPPGPEARSSGEAPAPSQDGSGPPGAAPGQGRRRRRRRRRH